MTLRITTSPASTTGVWMPEPTARSRRGRVDDRVEILDPEHAGFEIAKLPP